MGPRVVTGSLLGHKHRPGAVKSPPTGLVARLPAGPVGYLPLAAGAGKQRPLVTKQGGS